MSEKSKNIKKLILGENLSSLNVIYPKFKSKVKCIYIDPPYNNGELYNHYDDRKSEKWISELEARIKLMHKFLKDNGSMWISIDDNEIHYLKVALDDIFGRENFVTTIVWQQRTTRENRKTFLKVGRGLDSSHLSQMCHLSKNGVPETHPVQAVQALK